LFSLTCFGYIARHILIDWLLCRALEQCIEHLTQNATPIDIQQGFLQHLYEVVWRGAVPEEYGQILASMVSTMVPDTTDGMIYSYHAI